MQGPGTGERRALEDDKGGMDRALDAVYARLGTKIVYLALGVAGAIVSVTTVATVPWLFRYLGASLGENLDVLLVAVVNAQVGMSVSLLFMRRWYSMAHKWGRGERGPERAAEVWALTVRAPFRLVGIGALAICVMHVLTAGYTVRQLDLPLAGAVPLMAGIVCAICAGAVLVSATMELLLRPLREEAAAELPPEFEPTVRVWSLTTRAISPLPVVTFFSALVVGAYVDLASTGLGRLSVALIVGLLIVSVASLVIAVSTRSVLHPIRDLIAATRRVREGHLDTAVPLTSGGELGTLAHSFNRMIEGLREREALQTRNVELDSALQNTLADVRRHAEELRASRARIVTATDAERRRVERDLHDGAQQHLVLLNLKLGLLRDMVAGRSDAAAMVEELSSDLADALRELRDLAHGIYPPLLVNEGLVGALREAAARAAIPATVESDGADRYRPEVEAAVYFCCLEALQNAAKHAGAGAEATVSLVVRDGELWFEVADDGAGYDSESTMAGAGLQNMADRIGALGGRIGVTSRPGEGTRVAGSVPAEPLVPAGPQSVPG